MGWGGVGGEVDKKANTAPVVVEVKVGAELGNNSISYLDKFDKLNPRGGEDAPPLEKIVGLKLCFFLVR